MLEDDIDPFAFANEESFTKDELFLRGMECFDNYTWARILHSCPQYRDPDNETFLPDKAPGKPSHTLVLDLDETLITCYNEFPDPNGYRFTVGFDQTNTNQIDVTNPQTGEKETEEFFPLFRPYVFYFLKEMSKYYEVIAFTAAQSTYAHAIVDILNTHYHVIDYCLTREHTTFIEEPDPRLYYKDLRRLNRDLVRKAKICDN